MAASFDDPVLAVVEALRGLLAGRTEPFAAGATVGTLLPFTRALEAPSLPYVHVRLDASAPQYGRSGALEVASLGVSVWGRTDYDTLALARLCRALLADYGGDARVFSLTPLAGPTPTNDPDSGSPLSSFTLAARLRPITL